MYYIYINTNVQVQINVHIKQNVYKLLLFFIKGIY